VAPEVVASTSFRVAIMQMKTPETCAALSINPLRKKVDVTM
jgi:hypothetical protein